MNRATGLLVIEVINSNPNGNPDQESDPRQRPDERGMISPVSFKRKLRDLVEDKDGPFWNEVAKSKLFNPPLDPAHFQILESRDQERSDVKKLDDAEFISRYWDARLFGATFLEEKTKEAGSFIRTGVAQFGMGVSVSPIRIDRQTNTSKSGKQEGKDRGMAPLAYRVVQHGVYTMPYFVNAAVANKSGCTDNDVELMKLLIPHAYNQTASAIRPQVIIRHAWHMEHTSALGSCPDFLLLEALTPTRKNIANTEEPSVSWSDYAPQNGLPEELHARLKSCVDLVLA